MSDPTPHEQWERVAAELSAYRSWQRQAWGDLDDATLGRYLAGEATPEERGRVEAAANRHPEVRQVLDLVREVLDEPDGPGSALPADARPASGFNRSGKQLLPAGTDRSRGPWRVPSRLGGRSSDSLCRRRRRISGRGALRLRRRRPHLGETLHRLPLRPHVARELPGRLPAESRSGPLWLRGWLALDRRRPQLRKDQPLVRLL